MLIDKQIHNVLLIISNSDAEESPFTDRFMEKPLHTPKRQFMCTGLNIFVEIVFCFMTFCSDLDERSRMLKTPHQKPRLFLLNVIDLLDSSDPGLY